MDDELIDKAGSVRAGEELDAARIADFLRAKDIPEITQFPGGASNLTYLLRFPERELVLRRPPFGHRAKGAHDMLREARIMTALKPFYPYVPEVVALGEDEALLGAPFYVMDRIRGIIPRRNLPDGLELSEADTRRLCLSVIDRMIELHQVDIGKAGLAALGKGEGYVRRQVEGWSERCRKAATDGVADFEAVMAWLAARMPAREVAIRVIHNDFRFDNVVLDPDDPFRVIGVLDWELATLGDPLLELGNSLAYWVEAGDPAGLKAMRRQPTHLPGMLTRDEVIAYYGEKTGFSVADFDFYRICGLFRLAVIIKQIHVRYALGQTTNPDFAGFGQAANFLDQYCRDLIARSSL